MKTICKISILLFAVAVAWHNAKWPAEALSDAAPLRSTIPDTSDAAFHGMAIQLHGGTDVYDKYKNLIPEIAELGANTVLLVAHGWQTHGGSLDLRIDARKTADAEGLGKLCDLAASHGLRVILMPVVLLDEPRNREWRGRIVPEGHDWDEWFRRYTRFIVHFARIAEKHKAAMFMVGSELVRTEGYTERWKKVIEEVRQNYRGPLGYSANWDHYQTTKIGFWPQLDYVGLTSYYKLADGPSPTAEELDRNWAKFKKEILAFQAEVGKPIVFTEVGWCSQEGAAKEGWNYYAHQKATEAGHREQALLYEAFIRNWGDEPAVGGIIWWEWDARPGGPDDYHYTPRGKPAEQILRAWFARP